MNRSWTHSPRRSGGCSRTHLAGENVGRADPEELRRGCGLSVLLIERRGLRIPLHSVTIAAALIHCPAQLCLVFAIEATFG